MNKFAYIALPLLLLSISACSTNTDSSSASVSPSGDTSTSITSESEDGQTSSEKKWEKHISSLNPINEPLIGKQYYLNHIGDIYNTWKDLQGNGQTIAVIDVGFKYNHPDFVYEDGTSKVSKKSAYFSTSGSKTTTQVGTKYLSNTISDHGYNNDHGTFCAGVAAAGINKKGVIGVAPLAELLLLRTDGQAPSINEAFKYAADYGARVVSISIGSYANYEGDLNYDKSPKADLKTVFNDAVAYCKEKGTVVISAAGNGGNATPTYPGDSKDVIGVGGLKANESSVIWPQSSYNPSNSKTFCEVFAPSDGMYGCCDYNASKYDGGLNDDGSQKWVGTSFAAPIVAGIAALYFEKNPNNTVDEFISDLTNNGAVEFAPKTKTGHGRVDVGKLLGTTLTENVTAKAKDSEQLYAYCYNSITGTKEKAWPGTTCSKSGSNYTYNVDSSKYDIMIFNNGGDPAAQTVNLLASSFINGNVYDTSSPSLFGENTYIGSYIQN